MSDFDQKIERLREIADVEWSDARTKRVERAMLARLHRRSQTRVAGLGVAFAIAATAMVVVWQRDHRAREAPVIEANGAASSVVAPSPVDPAAQDRHVDLPGGGRATPLDAASVVAATADGIDVRGAARIASARPVRAHVAAFLIEVPDGGDLVVSERGERLRVEVTRGHAHVAWSGGARDVSEGTAAEIDATAADAGSATPSQGSSSTRSTTNAGARKNQAADAPWKALAGAGEYDKAYDALHAAGGRAEGDAPNDLLLAADVARLSHHPAQAVDPLETLLRDHADDARAPLAAFTLGRVLLEELARPGPAADAFAKARALAPSGSLAEDALAREVEAASRAGDASRAHDRAEEYLRVYPAGSRAAAVRRQGGIR